MGLLELPSGSHNHNGNITVSGLTAASAGAHTHAILLTGQGKVSGSWAGGDGDRIVNANIDGRTGTATTEWSGDHTHSISGTGTATITPSGEHTHAITGSITAANGGDHTHTVTGNIAVNPATAGGTVDNTGDGQAHENRPPYFALCFIMKL